MQNLSGWDIQETQKYFMDMVQKAYLQLMVIFLTLHIVRFENNSEEENLAQIKVLFRKEVMKLKF